ncbi:hypothetical protein N7540_002277 [Penicillium herquei]|nr:hypothetical protein N7540_002277 [Penicillium herquei]
MEALLDQSFDTRDHLIQAIKSQALQAGFVVVIGRSDKDRNIRLICDQANVHHDRIQAEEGSKRRKTSFGLMLNEQQAAYEWALETLFSWLGLGPTV